MGSALFCVAGLVTKRFAPQGQNLEPGGIHFPRVGAMKKGIPAKQVLRGRAATARH